MKMECPNCGGNIIYILNTDFVYCEHCNQKVEVSRVNISEFSKYVKEIKEKRIQNDNGTNSYIEKLLSSNESKEIVGINDYVYKCSNCNGEFIHSYKLKGTSCPFCFLESKKRVGKVENFKVSKVIPFTISKKSISNIICNCIESHEYAPENALITYVPFRASYDSVEGQGFVVGPWSKKTFSIKENIISLEYIGKSINKELAEQCIDFDFTKAIEASDITFNDGVVLDNIIVKDKEDDIIKNKIIKSINHDLYVKENLNSQRIKYDNLRINNIKEEIWLLPICIYKNYFKGKIRTLLINGQNGRIVGEAVSRNNTKAKNYSAFLTFVLIIFAIMIKDIINIIFGTYAIWIFILAIIMNGFLLYLFRFKTIRNVDSKGFAFYGISWNKDLKTN